MILLFKGTKPLEYEETVNRMEFYVDQIIRGEAEEAIWFLEHQDIITAGSSSKDEDLLDGVAFPVVKTGRGGQYTYHGPGQRIVYLMMKLQEGEKDLKNYVCNLEQVIINVMQKIGIKGARKKNRVGIWIEGSALGVESKIASLGIRVRKWVTYHGLSFNINPNLESFRCIVPCGIKGFGITSLEKEGGGISQEEFDTLFVTEFEKVFSRRCGEDVRIL